MRFAREDNILFHTAELDHYLQARLAELRTEIQSADEEYLLNVDAEQWAEHLVERYGVAAVEIHGDEMYVEDLGEAQVDVSHEYMSRAILDPSEPTYVPGRRVEARIPFDGNSDLLFLTPRQRTFSPPRASVRSGEIVLPRSYPADRRPDIRQEVLQELRKIENYVSWAEGTVNTFNANLPREALDAIRVRRERVLADHAHLDQLGIPVRRRDDAPKTFVADAVRRRPAPAASCDEATRAPSAAPDPTLLGELYEHALSVVRAMGHAMERSPADYATKGEETLRDQLLVMLNSHFEGQGQAEAFNKGGKTDILIRYADRNIFIAECKWWSGAKGLQAALEQLFSYSTWRDTKLALIVFVRQKNLTAVLEKARAVLLSQANFVSFESAADEAEIRCEMTWPGDTERHATLTVCCFHLTG